MGFAVDPDALDKCAKLLDRYGGNAGDVSKFFTAETSMSAHGEGLLSILWGGHAGAVEGMEQRTGLMQDVGTNSAGTLADVAAGYREMDAESAAELDAAYPDASPGPLSTDSTSVSSRVENFEDRADPGSALDVSLDGTSVKPGGFDNEICDSIDTWARQTADVISPAFYLRAWLNELGAAYFGWTDDPIDWVLDAFFGEWAAWGKCALVWDACGESVERMATNVEYIAEGLAPVWEGNAADAAMAYFQKMHSATKTESEAFTALSEVYKYQVEGIYDAKQMVNDLINTLLDVVLDMVIALGIAAVTGGIGLAVAAPWVAIALEVANAIASALTSTLNAARLFEHALKLFDLPEVPDCELDDLNKGGESPGYRKPKGHA